ncbi:hypothetical protein JCM11491_006331 [Sporobolomyces phaffii]
MAPKAARTSLDSADSAGGASAAPKRPRTSQSRVKGKKGALKVVMTLPVDLIYEICTHLEMGDLFALSNTSKAFRQVVTGENASSLFKRARERSEMPELLVPMSDLRYAALMFGKNCHLCGKNNAGKVDPSLRARICQACLKSKFVTPTTCEGLRKTNEFNHYTRWCAPHTVAHGRNGFSYHWEQVKRISRELDTRFPMTGLTRDIASMFADGPSDLGQTERSQIKSDWQFVLFMRPGHVDVEQAKPVGDFQTWYLEVHNEEHRRDQDTKAIQTWLAQAEKRKSRANETIRAGRREDIEARLEAIGFEKSEFLHREFLQHALVKSTRPLSDKTYSTSVEPVLSALLRKHRRDRIRVAVENDYYRTRRTHEEEESLFFPHASVYRQLPALASLLSDDSVNPSATYVIPAAVKEAALEETLSLIRDRRERLLRGIAAAHLGLARDLKEEGYIEEEDSDDEDAFAPTKYVAVGDLSLELPRLPPWIPRSAAQPIVASDEQLRTFLANSPLARFECDRCRLVFTTRQLFAHASSGNPCYNPELPTPQFSLDYDGASTLDDWIFVKDEATPLAERRVLATARSEFRINRDVLSLALRIEHLVARTPLVVDAGHEFDDLGPDYEIGGDNPDDPVWFEVSLHCQCPFTNAAHWSSVTPARMYQHLVKQHSAHLSGTRIKAHVEYSYAYRQEYRQLSRLKMMDAIEGDVDSDEMRAMMYPEGRCGPRHAWADYDSDPYGDDGSSGYGGYSSEEGSGRRDGCMIM